MTTLTAIECDEFLPYSADVVWRAITTPETIAKWWANAADLRPEVGHRFTIDMGGWGVQQCEVLEVEEGRLLRYTFAEGVLDSTLTWRIEPEGTGSRLFLVHGDLDADSQLGRAALQGMGRGWPDVLARIADVIRPDRSV
ncbi:SRPBCC domain-containing protein [Microbacterium sp. AZCO]|uniref:SRPBCC family protein n=1 Tax=Microbacterium sp. AZCO TaxID=3142976 RepID=UPI0031F33997